MCNNIRHGDLCLIWIDNLPSGLSETNSKILMSWNNGHNHQFDNWTLYIVKKEEDLSENEFVFWYFVAKDTTLYHEDHGELVEWSTLRIAKIPDWIYELRKQKEYTPDWLKPVID